MFLFGTELLQLEIEAMLEGNVPPRDFSESTRLSLLKTMDSGRRAEEVGGGESKREEAALSATTLIGPVPNCLFWTFPSADFLDPVHHPLVT